MIRRLRLPVRSRLHVFTASLLLFAGLALAACTSPPGRLTRPATSPDPAPLAALLVQRLQLAREVAWSKHHSGAPVHDPAREEALLGTLRERARSAGLPPDRIETFFAAQIAASRQVQTELLAAWAAGSAPTPADPPPDLRSDLRPRLDTLTRDLLAALAPWFTSDEDTPGSAPTSVADELARRLAAAGFSEEVAALALAPLRYP